MVIPFRIRSFGLASLVAGVVLFPGFAQRAGAQTARISEELRSLLTYPFSEPNPVPILARDSRLYPYHSFEGYSSHPEPREWKVVHLENDLIEVFVLPEVGGKVWGAIVKKTGHEFIYRNEVMKFRNIALRGPWTSGGIEFNFGVIGHTPATATPVDYVLRENADGSVSCIVGSMDLPSRTHWRVEIRLPADAAYFETRALWYNPTPLEQPYYNWMTAAAFARDDLEMSIPGNAYLRHSGQKQSWPLDEESRYLPMYRNNTFGGHKSYHVVGELNDFFGGYYHDDDYGFGHWARYEEMPGQKLWLWALSRQGGVWEDLLTDTDGQYVEYQAGPLLVQFSHGEDTNPITQAKFDPMSASRWAETWFPLEGTGGLSEASREGALHVSMDASQATIGVNAFRSISDTLKVWSGDHLAAAIPITLTPLEPFKATVDVTPGAPLRVRLAELELDYTSDVSDRQLSRPFVTDSAALDRIPAADRLATEGHELMKGRRHAEARAAFEAALKEAPWHRTALLGMADLAYRSGKSEEGLRHANRVLQLDAYDTKANFIAGILYRSLGRVADARDAFGWAARGMAYRSAAYAQLAEIMIGERSLREAMRYARLAIDYDRYSVPAWRILAVAGRLAGDAGLAGEAREALLSLDPLHHFVRSEEFLDGPTPLAARKLDGMLGGEFPEQTRLELAVGYAELSLTDDASRILASSQQVPVRPIQQAWLAFLSGDPAQLSDPQDAGFEFPFRRESLPALRWADENSSHWIWTYLLALNLWAVDRTVEAAELLSGLGTEPDFAPFYATRAQLPVELRGSDGETDLRNAVELAPGSRIYHRLLVDLLVREARWGSASAALVEARSLFPDDYELGLLDAKVSLYTGRALEAIGILDRIRVLPSEHARESHRLYEQAHELAALDALEAGDAAGARNHLDRALKWPESLGQGRPYEPEERLVRYLLGWTNRVLGRDDEAREHFAAVVDASDIEGDFPSGLDLLAVPSLRALGRPLDWNPVEDAPPSHFEGLEGRILHRTLSLEGMR